jgi:hypothetical protein
LIQANSSSVYLFIARGATEKKASRDKPAGDPRLHCSSWKLKQVFEEVGAPSE